jgi:hypothetical protein
MDLSSILSSITYISPLIIKRKVERRKAWKKNGRKWEASAVLPFIHFFCIYTPSNDLNVNIQIENCIFLEL